MDANAPRRRLARLGSGGGLSAVALVVVLVGIVAVASSGSTPSGGVDQRRPSDGLLDTFISLFLVVLVLSAVLAVVLLSFFGRYAPDGTAPRRRSWIQNLIGLLIAVVLIAVLVRSSAGRFGQTPTGGVPEVGSPGDPTAVPQDGYDPQFAVRPVVGVTVLAAIALTAWWLSARGRRSQREPDATPEEALWDVLATTLDDLRAESDPRRAVIRAYARMERSLAAVGLPRAPAEAPQEYLARILEGLPVSSRAAARLTALFSWARFSAHDVRPEMKDEAIETLEQVQRELAAAEAEREGRLEGALT
jgi:hypothetical protein